MRMQLTFTGCHSLPRLTCSPSSLTTIPPLIPFLLRSSLLPPSPSLPPPLSLPCLQVVSREIRRILEERAASFNIALDDVSITNLTFGREFTAAIEAKQVAAQEAERAKFVVQKAEQDKRSAIIRAQVSWHCTALGLSDSWQSHRLLLASLSAVPHSTGVRACKRVQQSDA